MDTDPPDLPAYNSESYWGRMKRSTSSKSARELLQSFGQLVRIATDCGTIGAIEALRLAVVNSE